MKKIFKIVAILACIPVLAFVVYFLYLMWPSFFPKYPINSCVQDTKVQRIHKITGFDNRYQGGGVPSIVLVTGMATPGTHTVGTKESIFIDDPNIQPVDCPK